MAEYKPPVTTTPRPRPGLKPPTSGGGTTDYTMPASDALVFGTPSATPTPVPAGTAPTGGKLAQVKKKRKEDEEFTASDVGSVLKNSLRWFGESVVNAPAGLISFGVGLTQPMEVKKGEEWSARGLLSMVPVIGSKTGEEMSKAAKRLVTLENARLSVDALKAGETPLPYMLEDVGTVALAGFGAGGALKGAAASQRFTGTATGARLGRAGAAVSKAANIADLISDAPIRVPVSAGGKIISNAGKFGRSRAAKLRAAADLLDETDPIKAQQNRSIAARLEARFGKDIYRDGVITTVTTRAVDKFRKRAVTRATANADKIANSLIEVQDQPLYVEEMGPLTPAENQAVFSLINGRAELIRAIAEINGRTPGELAYFGRYNFEEGAGLTPDGANLAVDFLNGNLDARQMERLADARDRVSAVIEGMSAQARTGYGRQTALTPEYDVPFPEPQRLGRAMAEAGRPDIAEDIAQRAEEGFFDDLMSPEVIAYMSQVLAEAPESVVLDSQIYPPKERNNIEFFKRVRESFEAGAAATVAGTPPPEGVVGGRLNPITEPPTTGVPAQPFYTTNKYPGTLARTPRRLLGNSIKILERLRGKTRKLGEQIVDAELRIKNAEMRIIKATFQIQALEGFWVDDAGNMIGPDADGLYPGATEYVPGLIERLREQRDELKAKYQAMLAEQAQSTVIDNVVVTAEQIANDIADLDAAVTAVEDQIEALDAEITANIDEIEAEETRQAQAANEMEDAGVDPDELIRAATEDVDAIEGAPEAYEGEGDATPPDDIMATAQAAYDEAIAVRDAAQAELEQARLAEIDAREKAQETADAYRESMVATEQAQRAEAAAPEAPEAPPAPAKENVLAVLNDFVDRGVIPSAVVKRIEKAYEAKFVAPKPGTPSKTVDKIAFSSKRGGAASPGPALMVNEANGRLWWSDSYAAVVIDPESALGKKLAQMGNEPGVYRTQGTGRSRADIERAPMAISGEAPSISALLARDEVKAAAKAKPAKILGIDLLAEGPIVLLETPDGARVTVTQENLAKVYQDGDTIHASAAYKIVVIKRDGEVVGIVMPYRGEYDVMTPESLYQKILDGQFGSVQAAAQALSELPTSGRLAAPKPTREQVGQRLTNNLDLMDAADTARDAWNDAQDAVRAAEQKLQDANNALMGARAGLADASSQAAQAVPTPRLKGPERAATEGGAETPGRLRQKPWDSIDIRKRVTGPLSPDIKAIAKAKSDAAVARTEKLNGKDMDDPAREAAGKEREAAARKTEREIRKRVKATIKEIVKNSEANAALRERNAMAQPADPDQVLMGVPFNEGYITQIELEMESTSALLETALTELVEAEIEYVPLDPKGARAAAVGGQIRDLRMTIAKLDGDLQANAEVLGGVRAALAELRPAQAPTAAVVTDPVAAGGVDEVPAPGPAQPTGPSALNESDWTKVDDNNWTINTGFRRYQAMRVEVGKTTKGQPRYRYRLARFGSDGKVIDSTVQEFGNFAAARKAVQEGLDYDLANPTQPRPIYRPGRELTAGTGTPMPTELIRAETKLASAEKRLSSLRRTVEKQTAVIDKARVDTAAKRATQETLTRAQVRLEARLGKEIVTQPDVAVAGRLGQPTGRVFVGEQAGAPRLAQPLVEGGVPRLGGEPLQALLRPTAQTVRYVTPQGYAGLPFAQQAVRTEALPRNVDVVTRSIDEANMARARELSPDLPVSTALGMPRDVGQPFLGSQYVPAGRKQPRTRRSGVAIEEGLIGDVLSSSQKYRTGKREEIYDIIDLANRLRAEQRTLDLNEAFRAMMRSGFAITPMQLLGEERVMQLMIEAQNLAYSWEGGTPPIEGGVAAYAEGLPNREAIAARKAREKFGELIDEEMRAKGFETIPTYGNISGSVNMEDVTAETKYLPEFVRERVEQKVRPVQTYAFVDAYLKTASRFTGAFKNLTLPFSIAWQIGDLVGGFVSAAVTGVSPLKLGVYFIDALRENYGGPDATFVDILREMAKEPGDRATSVRADVVAQAGLQDVGLRIGQEYRLRGLKQVQEPETVPQRFLKKYTPDVRGRNIGNLVPAWRKGMYRVNEAINRGVRHGYANILLDEMLAKQGLDFDTAASQGLLEKPGPIRDAFEDVIDTANDVMGDWLDLSPAERKYILPNATFYAWVKHIHKLFLKVAKEHPSALKWTAYLGNLSYDPDADPFGFLMGKIPLPGGGLAGSNFLNPFADVVEGPLGTFFIDKDPRRLLSPLSPLPRLLSAGVFGFDISQFSNVSRPSGTGEMSIGGSQFSVPLAFRPTEFLGFAAQQYPIATRVLDLLPSGQLPGTSIQTGPYERYDTGQARTRPGTRRLIPKTGGRAVGAARLLNLPFLPTTDRERLLEMEKAAAKRLRAFEKAQKRAEALND
jgi:hypothetical protein